MDNLNDLNNFLNEKKIVVKRRYTEAYPAKNVSTNARIRSVILDAISDGHITEEEMSKILSELRANKRWLGRNKTLFNISEDQAGIKTFSLSPYGLRVKNKTTILNEALNVPHKEKGKKPVNMFVGRFQPFTLGHVKVFEKMYKENGLPVVVYMVRGGKADPEKRPFDEDMQQAMFAKMKKQYPFLEASFVVPNGAIDTMFAAARPTYEPMMWGYGTDRKKSYGAMINKQSYRDDLGVDPSFKGFEIKRGEENISASKVRNALKIDDEKTFKKMTPKSIHKFYKPLQDIMQPIKENKDMKNLKSLTDFSSINEAKFNKKSLIKTMKKDDGMIQLGNGEEYVIYAFGNGNDDNDSMWGDKTIFALDQDGGEHEIKYSDIVSYNESVINENDAKTIVKAFMKTYNKRDEVTADDWEQFIYDWTVMGDGNNELDSELGYDTVDDVLTMLDKKGYKKLDDEGIIGLYESTINEDYIELMPEIANALGIIQSDWDRWKNGPMTEPSDIKPAAKELKGWITRWMKQNIK
jgi:cytidyltransferase-like protein